MNRSMPRVVIPTVLIPSFLKLLHKGHWGSSRMKNLARQYCYWHNIDKDIDELSKSCIPCRENAKLVPSEYTSWPKASSAFERVHVDFLGPFKGYIWLILVDAYSHFPFVVKMSGFSSLLTIAALKSIFAIEGLPETIVSDNGKQFVSAEFANFCNRNNIKRVLSPPYHPSSNGQAERFVQTFKSSINKQMADGTDLDEAVFECLLTYRSTPFDGELTPFELLHGRQARNFLASRIKAPKSYQWSDSEFSSNQRVWIREYNQKNRWLKGIVTRSVGSRLYEVKVGGRIMIRHRNQMRLCHRESNEEEIQYYHQPETTENAQEQETQQLRRSTRISRPPERFVPWWQGKVI
ncbi:Pro-Pol polyprotein [Thelohanellus kitauei]|uniref:Pro-Pol polyprotein n=1 Tax=Thelohanellus kitauei TaxID=669202 RepID=A0A0C2MB34_THEKT|nr:Pro-Pol polyprotein [Thelohanellus kitauei]